MSPASSAKYLITGARGMLGSDLVEALFGRDVTLLGRADLDVTDRDAVLAAVQGHDVVINAAAYTAVDAAETDEAARGSSRSRPTTSSRATPRSPTPRTSPAIP
jgi:dTDP-4-dehydrorhamnose reductase